MTRPNQQHWLKTLILKTLIVCAVIASPVMAASMISSLVAPVGSVELLLLYVIAVAVGVAVWRKVGRSPHGSGRPTL